MNKIFIEYNIETVFHFAASLNIKESQLNPKKYLINNFLCTKNLIEVSINDRINYFIFSSTCAIYKSKIGKIKEVDKKNLKVFIERQNKNARN